MLSKSKAWKAINSIAPHAKKVLRSAKRARNARPRLKRRRSSRRRW